MEGFAMLLVGFLLAVVNVNGNVNCHNNSTASPLNQLVSLLKLLQEVAANPHDNHCDNLTPAGSCNTIEKKIDDLKKDMDDLKTRLEQISIENKWNNNKYDPSPLLHSCEEIKTHWPNATSDYYLIADVNGQPRHVYCYMERLCNDDEGWMRVAYLNMTDVTEDCPPGFNLYTSNGIRACGRPSSASSGYCQSVKFPTYSINYTQVCGRVIGYQYTSPDAVAWRASSISINSPYVDGVSLTYGNPRKHIWTFMAALQANTHAIPQKVDECPCAPTTKSTPASFIGNDYFCESGCPDGHWQPNVLYSDPLWDGQQCGELDKPCCAVSGLPWFHKTLNGPTTDYIEMRICGDEGNGNEDVPVSYYELYVK
jgi:dynein heavy chain